MYKSDFTPKIKYDQQNKCYLVPFRSLRTKGLSNPFPFGRHYNILHCEYARPSLLTARLVLLSRNRSKRSNFVASKYWVKVSQRKSATSVRFVDENDIWYRSVFWISKILFLLPIVFPQHDVQKIKSYSFNNKYQPVTVPHTQAFSQTEQVWMDIYHQSCSRQEKTRSAIIILRQSSE